MKTETEGEDTLLVRLMVCGRNDRSKSLNFSFVVFRILGRRYKDHHHFEFGDGEG